MTNATCLRQLFSTMACTSSWQRHHLKVDGRQVLINMRIQTPQTIHFVSHGNKIVAEGYVGIMIVLENEADNKRENDIDAGDISGYCRGPVAEKCSRKQQDWLN